MLDCTDLLHSLDNLISIPVYRFGQSLGETNVIFLNGKPGAIEHEIWVQEITNGFARPIISTTNKFLVYAGIYECFRQIGIKASKQGVAPTVSPEERLIFIAEKQN